VVLVGLGLALVALLVWTFAAQPDETGPCPPTITGNLAPGAHPKWRLTKKPTTQINLQLDDLKDSARTGHAFVGVEPLKSNKTQKQLPTDAHVGGFIEGGALVKGGRELPGVGKVRGRREPSGESVRVDLCVRRPSGADTSPGRYTGIVRVGGRSIVGTELRTEVTTKTDRRLIVWGLFILGCVATALAAGNSRPSEVEPDKVAARQLFHDILWFFPIAAGVVVAVGAGVFVYQSNATWGAADSDWVNAALAAIGGATAGITALAPASRRLRKNAAEAG
jgi:hypothetical protein